ncbi:MAG TPA: tetratricopeptide repeat protein [Methylomirabilota bacterium]|nr:tetratricopeptide repeat protein [Methylomirabilota bacterium]
MKALRAILPLLVAAACFAAFLPALEGQFLNWDDSVNFLGNPGYRGLGWRQIHWMFTTALMGHYIPVTWLTLGANYVAGGMNPWGYHLLSLLVHATNATLFYFVSRRLLSAAGVPEPAVYWAAAFASLLFGVHPLRVESVAWVTERRDVLCGLFFLLAVLAYLRGVEAGGPLRGRWRALSLLAFAASLLSKAAAMPLPLVLLLLDVYPLRRRGLGWRRLALEKAPYAMLAAAAAVIALVVLPQAGAVTGYEQYGPLARLGMVGYSLIFYPRKFLWPSDLSPLYELPARVELTEWRFAASLAAVVVVSIALVLARRRWPAGLAAWTYSALMLLPVSGIIHSGHQLAHDRYSYLSSLSFALLGGAAVAWVLALRARGRIRPFMTAVLTAGATLAIAGLAAGSWEQSYTWRDSETLWRWAVDVDPRCAVCRLNLGQAVTKDAATGEARLGEAESLVREAIRLKPDYAEAYYNLGTALLVQKRYDEAEVALRAFVRLAPARAVGPERLGVLYLVQGRYAEAMPLLHQAAIMRGERTRSATAGGNAPLSEALGLLSDTPETLVFIGRALVEQERRAEAIDVLRRAAALDPTAPAAPYWLARAYRAAGDRQHEQEALATLRALDPALAARVPAR